MSRDRRASRPRSQSCPSCGAPVFWAVYVPEPRRLDPTRPRRRLPLDAAPNPLGDPLTSHAASTGRTTCRLITAEHPLEPTETAHSLHYATHPACRDALLTPATTRRTR